MRFVTVVRQILAGGLLIAALLGSAFAAPEGSPAGSVSVVAGLPGRSVTSPRATVTLLSEQGDIRAGRTLWFGLHFRLTPGWHIYWQNPGDSGAPPMLTWRLPEGVQVGPVVWPIPHRIPVGPLVNFGYEGEVLLTVPITVPDDYGGRRLPAELTAEWLVCEVSCIPESGRFTLDLPVRAAGEPVLSGEAPLFAAQRLRVPNETIPEGWRVGARVADGQVAVRIDLPSPVPALADVTFFPFGEGLMQPAAKQFFRSQAGGYTLTLSGSDSPIGEWSVLSGVFVGQPVDRAAPQVAFAVETPIVGHRPGAIRPASPVGANAPLPAEPSESVSFGLALGLALIGGALLNLMPCVFPVLSIKLLGLLRAGGAALPDAAVRRVHRLHAAGYALGVIATFLALAGMMLAVRALGETLGWGFQLQSPAFVGGMAVFFFAFGLVLSGALPFATLGQDVPGAWRLRHPLVDAVFSGVLAVLVASPCTAPFMGAALGAALLMSTVEALAVFLFLGLGMALPYSLFAAWPAGLARLPRPGPWMLRLKEVLAFPLYATVVWLAWVLLEQVGAAGILPLGAALLVVALVAWLLGWVGERGRLAVILSAVGFLGALLIQLEALEPPARTAAPSATVGHWGAWTPELVDQSRAAGQTVFVDFTAAWCITCQVNKRLVLNRAVTQKAFEQAGVRTLRADWTLHDPAITAEITRLGRSGVPVYAFYPPQGAPVVLPELLTVDLVRDALTRLAPPAGKS